MLSIAAIIIVCWWLPGSVVSVQLRILLSRGSECLSDYPRWMFKKNSMEFFVGLQSYLYYCYSGCTLKSHDYLLFPECSMVTWPCYVTLAYSVPILPFTPLYTWVFEMCGEPFSYSRFLQQIWLLGSLSSMLSNKKDLLTSSLRWSLLAPASISCILQALLAYVSRHLINSHWPFC